MAEVISCPSCSRKLQVPESLLGQDVQCPSCSATFVASAGITGSPPPMPPSSPGRGYEELPPRRDDYDDYDDLDRPIRRKRRDLTPHRGVMILIFGILGIVICPIFGPIAWVMGNGDLTEIRAGRMDNEGEGMTQAGRILGIISSVIMILYLGFVCLFFMAAAAGGMR